MFKVLKARVYEIGDDQNTVQVRVCYMNQTCKRREGGVDVGRKGGEEEEMRKRQKQKGMRRWYVRLADYCSDGALE